LPVAVGVCLGKFEDISYYPEQFRVAKRAVTRKRVLILGMEFI